MGSENQYSTFNVGELTKVHDTGALRLARFPSRLEPTYSMPGAKYVGRHSTGCEIRFVPQNEDVILRLSSAHGADVQIFQGDFYCKQTLNMEPGRIYEIECRFNKELLKLPQEALDDCLFAPNVMRMRVTSGVIYFHGLDTYGYGSRKPAAEELPNKTWLAWGSSITQNNAYGHVHQAAHRLGVQVLNKGQSGSCSAEPHVAKWLVEENEWDFITCEWGINMRVLFLPEEYEQRITECIQTLASKGKPIFLITTYPNDGYLGMLEKESTNRQIEFIEIMRETYKTNKPQFPNLHLIEGKDVLKKWNWLTADLVHPTQEGQGMMGEALANIIKEYI